MNKIKDVVLCGLYGAFLCFTVPGVYAADDVPLEITADKALEWNDLDKTYVARGAARAQKGNMMIAADTLSASYSGASDSADISSLRAEGHVVITVKHPEGDDVATGDKATYDLKTGLAVLTGSDARPKVIRAGGDTLEADQISLQMDVVQGEVQQSMNHAVATGHVIIVSGDNKATGDQAVYTSSTNIAEMNGHVVITQGQNVIEGEAAAVNLTTHVSRVTGQKGEGRVKGVFYPGSGKKR